MTMSPSRHELRGLDEKNRPKRLPERSPTFGDFRQQKSHQKIPRFSREQDERWVGVFVERSPLVFFFFFSSDHLSSLNKTSRVASSFIQDSSSSSKSQVSLVSTRKLLLRKCPLRSILLSWIHDEESQKKSRNVRYRNEHNFSRPGIIIIPSSHQQRETERALAALKVWPLGSSHQQQLLHCQQSWARGHFRLALCERERFPLEKKSL